MDIPVNTGDLSSLCFLALLDMAVSFACLVLSCSKLFVASISMLLVLSAVSSQHVVALVATARSLDWRISGTVLFHCGCMLHL